MENSDSTVVGNKPGTEKGETTIVSTATLIGTNQLPQTPDRKNPTIRKHLTGESAPLVDRDGKSRWILDLKKPVQSGSQSNVYSAEDSLNKDRFVKVKALKYSGKIDPNYSELNQTMADIEGDVLASMHHDNIVRILDKGNGFFPDNPRGETTPYIVMENLGDNTLAKMISEGRTLSSQAALKLVKEITSAIDYARSIHIDFNKASPDSPAKLKNYKNIKGIIHFDIKPENLILHDGKWKVIDYGISGFDPNSDGMVGTPLHIAPEWLDSDKTPDYRADLYSLASSLYFDLTGEPPYANKEDEAMEMFLKLTMHNIKLDPLKKLESGDAYNEFFIKALNKDPEKRFQSGEEMAIAFEEAVKKSQAYKDSSNPAL